MVEQAHMLELVSEDAPKRDRKMTCQNKYELVVENEFGRNVYSMCCRQCEPCFEARRQQWIGIMLAEAINAKSGSFVTLTYGGDRYSDADHPNAHHLEYSDVQKYLKVVRRHGFPVKYLCSGEYGSRKGRAHWHLIMLWQGEKPDVDTHQRVNNELWPHGFSWFEDLTFENAQYACKYITKSLRDDAAAYENASVHMSKRPSLATAFLTGLAEQYVQQGLPLNSRRYQLDNVIGPRGVPRDFYVAGNRLDAFCGAYVEAWRRKRPGQRLPVSEVLDIYDDRQAKAAVLAEFCDFTKPRAGVAITKLGKPTIPTPNGEAYWLHEPTNSFKYMDRLTGEFLVWSFDQTTGARAWVPSVERAILSVTDGFKLNDLLDRTSRDPVRYRGVRSGTLVPKEPEDTAPDVPWKPRNGQVKPVLRFPPEMAGNRR